MELTPEHKKIIDEQKKQCPFCKIVKGEIPSKVLFQNDELIVLLDINPLSDGHVLMMPKEHYPIMPFIPEKTLDELFNAMINLSHVLKVNLMKSGSTIFIANGAAAGQQSTHFLLHIIPREKNVHPPLNLEDKPIDKKRHDEIFNLIKGKINSALSDEKKKFPEENIEEKLEEEVLRIINHNPELKKLILEDPETVKKAIPNHPQLSKMFHRVSFDKIVKILKKDEKNGNDVSK